MQRVRLKKPIPANRSDTGRFIKGFSGNPLGRPKVIYSLREQARNYTQQALDTLVRALNEKGVSWAVRVAAAREILDRAYGRAPQSLDLAVRAHQQPPMIDASMTLEQAAEAYRLTIEASDFEEVESMN